MRGVYLLLLVLAAMVAGLALEGWPPHPAGGAALAPVQTPQRAAAQQSCVDDVSIIVNGVYDTIRPDYGLNTPPDYADGDSIWIGYTVTNTSCEGVTVTVVLTGSESEKTIHVKSSSADLCTTGCTVLASGTAMGWDRWDLGKHPNTDGEKVVATVTVTAPADFDDTKPSNNSATSTQAINIVNEVPAPDIAVKSVTASDTTAVVGDTVDFTVVIENEGDADADAGVTVTLDLGEDTDELDSATVSDLDADDETTVTLSWDTTDAAAGDHSVRVLAEAADDSNSDNDSETVDVTLQARSVGVAVKSVTVSPSAAVIGDTVDFTVTLENDGNVAAVKPTVALYQGSDTTALVTATAFTLAVGAKSDVTLSWDTTTGATAGTHTMRAVATVTGDDDATNNSGSTTLTLHDPVDVKLSFAEALAPAVVRGNDVELRFTLSNEGDIAIGAVTVNLYVTEASGCPTGDDASGDDTSGASVADGGAETTPQPVATVSITSLAVAGSESGVLTWETDDADVCDYKLRATAATDGDTDASNNAVTADVEVRNWLKLKSVFPAIAGAVAGETVEFTVEVENVGGGAVTDVFVGLYPPLISTPLDKATIGSLAAGGTATATLEWDTTDLSDGDFNLSVAIGGGGQDPDRDDGAWVSVTLRNTVAIASASLASKDNVAGNPVSINVQVSNESSTDTLDGATVDLFVGDSTTSEDTETTASIVPGSTDDVTLTWDTTGVDPGQYVLMVKANAPGFGSDADDQVSISVPLRAPVFNVSLTQAVLKPRVATIGETLEVTATVRNRSEVAVSAPVHLYSLSGIKQMTRVATVTSAPIAPRADGTVALSWNTDTDDPPVGTHNLRVIVDLPGDRIADDDSADLVVELFRSLFADNPGPCLDDVRVRMGTVRDDSGNRRAPPNYQVNEYLRLPYTIYNHSCDTDVEVSIAMTHDDGNGDEENINGGRARCFSGCLIPDGGMAEGEVAWSIPSSPASNRPISAKLTVTGPDGFTDANTDNNTSDAPMRIVHPTDVVLYQSSNDSNRGNLTDSLSAPDFGEVDVQLVSASPARTVLPFADYAVKVTVEVANAGDTPEPAAVRFLWNHEELCISPEICSHIMVIPAGQTKTEILLPVVNLPDSVNHKVQVVLSAAVDMSLDNNEESIQIRRLPPVVDVKMTDVTVLPDDPFIGEEATVYVTVRNQSDIPLPLNLNLYLDYGSRPIATEDIAELAAGGEYIRQLAWRISPAARFLGPRKLILVASAEGYGNVAVTEKDVTLRIDAEIVGVRALPEETAMQGEEVAIEVEVRNNGPATANLPVTLRFPSAAKAPEVRRPSVRPGATGVAGFTWRTRDYASGEHSLIAEVPAEHNVTSGDTSSELPFQIMPLAISATILGIEVSPDAPRVGEPVTIAVSVRNDGPVAARMPVTLRFPSAGGRQPETRSPWAQPGESAAASFTWRTGSYEPGAHGLRVEAANDPPVSQQLTIQLLPPLVDVAIVGMGADPAQTAMVGEPVEVWVEVHNDGLAAIDVPVQLTFPSADKQPERKTTRVAAGETTRVTFTWKTADYPAGAHTLRSAIQLPGVENVTEGKTDAQIDFILTPPVITASIVDVSITPETPRVGEAVTVTVTVRNDSPIAAKIPVTLRFPSADKQPETRRPRVEPSATESVSFTWRTGNYPHGKHTFSVEVASAPPSTSTFTIELLAPIVNVAIVGMGSDPIQTAMVGEPVAVWVEVRNGGLSAVSVPVQLTFPSADKKPERKSARVAPGATGRVTFTWMTSNYKAGTHTLSAAIQLPGVENVTEGKTDAQIDFILTPPVITASIVNVSITPETPRVGEAVTVTVTVRNDSPIAANIPVTLHFPLEGKRPETHRHRVEPGATGSVSFTWRTGSYTPGEHTFSVEVTGTPPLTSTFTVELLAPIVNVAIVGMGSDPIQTAMVGEPVEVWVEVRNDGRAAIDVPVQLTFPSADKVPERKAARVAPGETARVTFTWKTTNYPAGEHTLRSAIQIPDNVTRGKTNADLDFLLTPPVITATIVEVSASPKVPTVGEPVTIAVTVRNDGPVAANIPVTLRFPSVEKQPETQRPRVEPGAIGTASFTWHTGNYPPGEHAFMVEVASAPPSMRTFTAELLAPIINAVIVGMGSDPAGTAMVGEPVAVWVEVRNDGLSAVSVPVQLAFPSDDKKPERKSARVAPGATGRVTFTWMTSNYKAGTHTLSAAIQIPDNFTGGKTDEQLEFLLTPPVVTATIVDVSASPNAPTVGENVTITVTVRNDSPIAANIPVTLHFPLEDKRPETRRHRVEPGATGTAAFTWRTGNYPPGEHTFSVEVASAPPLMRTFTVELLAPIINAAIVGMGTDPAGAAMIGEPVAVWVEVRNGGLSAVSVPVQLTFPSADKKPERKSARVAPGATGRMIFTWKTSNYEAGVHTLLSAIQLPENVTGDKTVAEIDFILTPPVITATIVDVSASPNAPTVGEPVTITVTVRNDGPVAANIPVNLRFPSEDKQPETQRPRVEPGAIREVRFTWRTGRYSPGLHSFVAEVASTPPSARPFTIELLPALVNVGIVGMGSDPAGSAVRGQHVDVWVDVTNHGLSAVNVPVQLAFPAEDKKPERKSPRVEPGEKVRVHFTWKTANYRAGAHTLSATLPIPNNAARLATSASLRIRLVAPTLKAAIVGITWNPDSPVVGDPVAITVTVRNDGPLTSSIPITLHFPSADKLPETRRPRVAPGAVGSASFAWRTSRYEPGAHVFRAQIPGVAGAVRTFEIELRPPEVDFAVAGFQTPDPLRPIVKGDWVELTVVVQNQGPYAGRGIVYLLNAANHDTMYEQSVSLEPGESRDVEFTWKTLRYAVGDYELRAVVSAEYDAEPDNNRSPSLAISLLTDRDITVGFGNRVQPASIAGAVFDPHVQAPANYPDRIILLDGGTASASAALAGVAAIGQLNAAPMPADGGLHPAAAYWLWRAAQISPWQCARLQRVIGSSLPRAALCPGAPALVR